MKEEKIITQEQINEWKEKYKFVYKVLIDGSPFYFRTLNREDYLAISTKQAAMGQGLDYELETVKMCLLTEIDEDTLKAKGGVVTVLSEKIMAKSGFLQIEEEEL